MRAETRRALYLLTGICFCVQVAANTQISISDERPVKGEEVQITVRDSALELYATYRPNSALVVTDTLRRATTDETFIWTPGSAGIVKLVAGSNEMNVSVRFSDASFSGILVMIIAGAILFGGAVISMVALMRNKSIEELTEEVEHRPDT